jgi:hypothetical protein
MIQHDARDGQVSPSQNLALQEALKIPAKSQDVDHLEICLTTDGRADFSPRTNNPKHLYQRLRWLVKLLRQCPELLRHAAGACEGGHRHAQGRGGHG